MIIKDYNQKLNSKKDKFGDSPVEFVLYSFPKEMQKLVETVWMNGYTRSLNDSEWIGFSMGFIAALILKEMEKEK